MGFSTQGKWSLASGGYDGDLLAAQGAASATKLASWSFDDLVPGRYLVSTSWRVTRINATDATYVLRDAVADVPIASAIVDQRQAPDDFTDGGTDWENLAEVPIAGSTLVVELSNLADGRVMADAVRIERIGDLVTAPDIAVSLDGTNIANGIGVADLGSTFVGVPLVRTFRVRNTGQSLLSLQPIRSVPDGFTLASNLADRRLAPNEETTFTIQFDAATEGTSSGTISFDNNDPDESPFHFAMRATTSRSAIIDDGDDGFSTSGRWSKASGGYQVDTIAANGPPADGDEPKTATWSFTQLSPGRYLVSTTWRRTAVNTTAAEYRVSETAMSPALILPIINQRQTPNDFHEDGADWENLGIVDITGAGLVVSLSNAADGRHFADAVRIERIGERIVQPNIEVTQVGGGLLADGTGVADFGTILPDGKVTQTFRVQNTGQSVLTLQSIGDVPAGFSIVTNLSAGQLLSPGESIDFSLRFSSRSIGEATGSVAFANSDPDTPLFDFTVIGRTDAAVTVDDGDDGFVTLGRWSPASGGREVDIHVAQGQVFETMTAQWRFDDLADGVYRVAATWRIGNTNATDATYRIRTGLTRPVVASATINQRPSPDDFDYDGSPWEILSEVRVTGGQVVVELSNQANGRVIADAVLLQRVDHHDAREANLDQLGLRLHEYHNSFGQFPVDNVPELLDASGRPFLSWRVHLLPYLGEEALYNQFHLDEPWDSPHNIQLIDQMPDVFRSRGLPEDTTLTGFQLFIHDEAYNYGRGSVYDDKGVTRLVGGGPRIRDVTDGTSNTIAVIETMSEDAVIWTKPDADIAWEPTDPYGGLTIPPDEFLVLMFDGSVRTLHPFLSADDFRGLVTFAGGETVGYIDRDAP